MSTPPLIPPAKTYAYTYLAWGLPLLIVGSALMDAGQAANLRGALDLYARPGGGNGLLAVGAVLGIAGLVLAVMGALRIARTSDNLQAWLNSQHAPLPAPTIPPQRLAAAPEVASTTADEAAGALQEPVEPGDEEAHSARLANGQRVWTPDSTS